MAAEPSDKGELKLPQPPSDGGPPDLQAWVEFYGGYGLIPWVEWDRLCDEWHERRRRQFGHY